MTLFFRQHFSSRLIISPAAIVVLLVLWPARRLDSENFVFYLPNQRRLIPIWTSGNRAYLPILPMLELTGQAGMTVEKRNSLEIFVGGIPLKLRRNETKVQAGKLTITLQEPILRANGQWLAPTEFLSSVLPSLIGPQIVYRPGTDRAFLDGLRPITFAVRLQPLAAGARLVVTFTGAVTIQTAATNGEWVIYIRGAAIQPLEQNFFFQNPYMTKLRFDDQDGRPKLILTPGLPGLDFYPRLTGGGETLVADVVNPHGPVGSAHGTASPLLKPSASSAQPPGKPATAPAAQGAPPLPAVVLDAGHGGPDFGARSEDGILEKNLTAQLAGLADAALNATKVYRVVLTRSGDSDPSFEQRTVIANEAHPLAFITFHAGELGDQTPVIVVYTYAPPSPPSAAVSGPGAPLFVRWDWAQAFQESKSAALARDLQKQFGQIPGIAAAQVLRAPVRQLRSINAPAVAVEMGTLAPREKAGQLAQPGFQKQAARAVAAALQQFSASAGKP